MFILLISEDLTLNPLAPLKPLMIPLITTIEEIQNAKMGLWKIHQRGKLKNSHDVGLRPYVEAIFQPTLLKKRQPPGMLKNDVFPLSICTLLLLVTALPDFFFWVKGLTENSAGKNTPGWLKFLLLLHR